MIKGFLMASGYITLYILYGKNADGNKRMIGYSLLNIIWLFTLFGSIFGSSEPILQIVCIAATIAYPAIITICGIKNRKNIKDINQKAESKGLTTDEYIKSEIPAPCLEIAEQYRGCPTELNAFLKDCVKSGKITKEQSLYIYKEFSSK